MGDQKKNEKEKKMLMVVLQQDTDAHDHSILYFYSEKHISDFFKEYLFNWIIESEQDDDDDPTIIKNYFSELVRERENGETLFKNFVYPKNWVEFCMFLDINNITLQELLDMCNFCTSWQHTLDSVFLFPSDDEKDDLQHHTKNQKEVKTILSKLLDHSENMEQYRFQYF